MYLNHSFNCYTSPPKISYVLITQETIQLESTTLQCNNQPDDRTTITPASSDTSHAAPTTYLMTTITMAAARPIADSLPIHHAATYPPRAQT